MKKCIIDAQREEFTICMNGVSEADKTEYVAVKTVECTPMAESCECMAKPLQHCKIISLQVK